MHRLRQIPFICVFVCLVFLFSFADEASADYSVVVASDLHYIAPSLTDGGEFYQHVLKNGDSKFMPYIQEITDAFFEEVMEAKPDALLLTGDLSFNGAIRSHEALIEKLCAVEAAGIPVLVQTGNHDVYNLNAAYYHGDSYTLVPAATTESFGVLYADFGLKEALAADKDSLSYVYPLNESTWVLMLDLNTSHDFCGLSDSTLEWIEAQLRAAWESGVTVLAAGHQNLFQHSIFRSGYVIDRADALSALFREYGVSLYLSGHLHIQHVKTEAGITEIASSALCSYPCQYGVLCSSEGKIHYETKRLDMAAFADKHGLDDPVFQQFCGAAAVYMTKHFSGTEMAPMSADPAEWERLLRYLQDLNLAYFSGDLTQIPLLDPDGALAERWCSFGDLTSLYVQSIQSYIGQNYCVWESP